MSKQVISNIKKLRELNDLTQEYVADELGLTRGAYNQIENGRTRLTVDKLIQIAQLFNTSIEEVIHFEKGNAYKHYNNASSTNQFQEARIGDYPGRLVLLEELVATQRDLIAQLKAEIDSLKHNN